VDVKELLENKHLDYISKGRDYTVKCLNPEHEDTNPSMNIDKVSGLFNCFSCGYKGNVFDYFEIKKENLLSVKIMQVKEMAQNLLASKPQHIPLDARYIDKDFRGISKSTLRKFGAFTSDSMMEGRIIFPITNINRDIVGFNGRFMYSDLEPKYKIHPEHTSLPLFPSVVTPIHDSIVLVEGLFDMLNLHDKGLTNAVCTFGTAFGNVKAKIKKQNNIDKLLQFKFQGIEKFWVMYDGDSAGQIAAKNLVDYAKAHVEIEDVELFDGTDPGSLSEQEVKHAWSIMYG
jgi:DNA primase